MINYNLDMNVLILVIHRIFKSIHKNNILCNNFIQFFIYQIKPIFKLQILWILNYIRNVFKKFIYEYSVRIIRFFIYILIGYLYLEAFGRFFLFVIENRNSFVLKYIFNCKISGWFNKNKLIYRLCRVRNHNYSSFPKISTMLNFKTTLKSIKDYYLFHLI